MSPTENAQLTEPDTEALPRYDGPGPADDGRVDAPVGGAVGGAVDDGTGPLTLAPEIEESQRLRGQFLSLVDVAERPDTFEDLDGERVWGARRLAVVLVALALLAVTVGITLIGLGGTDQRRPEGTTDAAAVAAAAQADAGRSQVTAVPATPTAVATPAVTPGAGPSATASPAASTASPTSSATASASPAASPKVSPTASASPKPSPKPPAPRPSPSASKPKPAAPACSVSRSAQAQLFGYRATATVTNKGGKALEPWTVSFQLPVGYIVQTLDGGVWNQSGTTVDVMNGSRLAPGASATIRFSAWAGLNPPNAGTGYTLSGTSCR